MLRENCRVGMKVYFGRRTGEKTLGEVIKMNPKAAKVKTLEDRGNGRGSSPGTVWGVPYGMMTQVDNSTQPVQPVREKLKYSPFMQSVDLLILEALHQVYSDLSPENLTCDGELPPHHVRIRENDLNRKRKGLEQAFGREVSPEELYEFFEEKRKADRKTG